MRWITVVAALGMGTFPIPDQVPSATQEPAIDGPDIVVIARKLRKVRIHYAMRGPFVLSCTTEVSSGDERIDRIMCAILRACVKSGAREVEEAKACMAARVDSLDDAARAAMLANPGAAVAAAPPGDLPTAQDPSKHAGPDIVVHGSAPDITVTGNVASLRGGLWQFRRGATLTFGGGGRDGSGGGGIRVNSESRNRGSGGQPVRFTQCLPDGTLEAMLRRAAGESNMMTAMVTQTQCGRLRTKMADGRIDASRSCITARTQRRLAMTGRYDRRQLTLNYSVEQDHDGLERGGGVGWNPARPVGYRWQVTATRIGECPLTERRDEVDANEAILALFSEYGLSDSGTLIDS